jgi:hypothetical protein
MAGFDPAIHVYLGRKKACEKAWMARHEAGHGAVIAD